MFFDEWTYMPSVLATLAASPQVWLIMLIGVTVGYIVGVLPGLGPTMGMALSLGIIFKLPPAEGLALLIAILVSAIGTGGITASLANIPGTAAAAATCLDGYALTLRGKGREAVGISVLASTLGTIIAMLLIFAIQPFVVSVALRFGDWEVFLFCLFGLLICGSLSGKDPIRGWAAGLFGLLLAMVGAEGVQSVSRFTFGSRDLLTGFDTVAALLGLFGLSEVFIVLKEKAAVTLPAEKGYPILDVKTFLVNKANIMRSMFAGVFVGFIPGVGESAACWFSYDLAKRFSAKKEAFGQGSKEGIIAAEVANNASSVGALIPSLALGIPGSATTAIFLAGMYLLNYRPGPTLLMESPGVLCELSIYFIASAVIMCVFSYFFSRYTIRFLSIPRAVLMPFVVVLCALGAWSTSYNAFSFFTLAFFGIMGALMKIYGYPIPPMVLGLLIGGTADISFRRAVMQYADNPWMLLSRPFGLAVMVCLVLLFIVGLKTRKD